MNAIVMKQVLILTQPCMQDVEASLTIVKSYVDVFGSVNHLPTNWMKIT